MPTELEELVEFLHHGNTQIRQIAAENLVPYSQAEPSLFKRNQLEPIKDLKLLIKDYDPIKKNTLSMLINLSGDKEVRDFLAKDDSFMETLLSRITELERASPEFAHIFALQNQKEPFADDLSMLLANLTKSDSLTHLFDLKRAVAPNLGGSSNAMDQLMDLFVRGGVSTNDNPDDTSTTSTASPTTTTTTTTTTPSSPSSSWNKSKPGATYDHLAYVFADLAKHPAGTAYLTGRRAYDNVVPIQKLLPFTTVGAGWRRERRLGVASAIKNVAFAIERHTDLLLDPDVGLLGYLLLPLADGQDTYDDDEQDELLDDLQFLDPGHRRDPDPAVLATHLDTLLLLGTNRVGRRALRDAGCYYVVRECHKAVEDDGVRMGCDRLVQVLQRGEPEAEGEGEGKGEAEDDDDDDKVVEID